MAEYIFKRVEYKYLLNINQYKEILKFIAFNLKKDKYFKSTIQSLYYDKDNFEIIRNSNDKPEYKEKLRARSYGLSGDKDIFLELKKKYDGIVYKRRVNIKEKNITMLLKNNKENLTNQIEKEINFFASKYKNISPKILIIYDRIAFIGENKLRITFDFNIRYRLSNLNLNSSLMGKKLFEDNTILMEIKCADAFPMWLSGILSKNKIYKTSFSKCGKAYEKEINTILDNKEIKIYG